MVIEAFIQALQGFMHLEVWLLIFAGSVMGLTFGAIPGLSAIVAMSILLPFVFLMTPEQALPMFIAVAATTYTAGSIPSILLNIPGTPVNVATLIDGFPMTQKGEASRALGAALMSSGLGGIISVIFALVMVPLVLALILALRTADMVFLILMGLAFVAVLSREAPLKGLIMGGVGLMLSLIGMHEITGEPRFTFGTVYLLDGLGMIPVVLGLYAVPEMISLAARGGTLARLKAVILTKQGVLEGMKDVFRHWGLWLRSSIIGYIIGVIPGVGAATATFVAYGQAKQISKHPETFGTGIVEGVIAPESCNNAKEGGALLTTLALGIPGSSEMVILLGAIMMVGIRPGPDMMTIHLPLSFNLLQVLFLGSFFGAAVCLLLAPYMAKVATIPGHILAPIVTVIVFIGTFASEGRILDLVVLLIFGLLGLAMKKYGFNRPALLLGFILGHHFERYLFFAYGMTGALFFLRPISLSIIFIIIALFCFEPVRNLLARRSKGGTKKA